MAKILGYEQVMRNLNREINKIQGKSMEGLIRAAIHVRQQMDTVPPLIPVDTGNLRQSWRMIPNDQGERKSVLMGFSANYALFVHEKENAHFKRPGAGVRFFEVALDREKGKIVEIIQKTAKV